MSFKAWFLFFDLIFTLLPYPLSPSNFCFVHPSWHICVRFLDLLAERNFYTAWLVLLTFHRLNGFLFSSTIEHMVYFGFWLIPPLDCLLFLVLHHLVYLKTKIDIYIYICIYRCKLVVVLEWFVLVCFGVLSSFRRVVFGE